MPEFFLAKRNSFRLAVSIAIGLMTASLMIFSFQNCAPQNSVVGRDSSAGQDQPPVSSGNPTQILFSAISNQGIGDPSITQDPSTSRMWMSYSAVDSSPSWPAINKTIERTRLAYSDNLGQSWTEAGVAVNDLYEKAFTRTQTINGVPQTQTITASWVSETSQLIYDPNALPGQKFKLLWHHYMVSGDDRVFADGWLGMKMADSPLALTTAPEVKLFAGNSYDVNANNPKIPPFSPVPSAPVLFVNTLTPALSSCALASEPGLYANESALYASFNCYIPSSNPSDSLASDTLVVLLKCASPCDVTKASNWKYVSTLFNKSKADFYGFDDGFTASSLFQGRDGQMYISVTPQQNSGSPWLNYYSGCYIFRFDNFDLGLLSGDYRKVGGTPGSFNGACAYHKASLGGVLYLELDISTGLKDFQIFSSGIGI